MPEQAGGEQPGHGRRDGRLQHRPPALPQPVTDDPQAPNHAIAHLRHLDRTPARPWSSAPFRQPGAPLAIVYHRAPDPLTGLLDGPRAVLPRSVVDVPYAPRIEARIGASAYWPRPKIQLGSGPSGTQNSSLFFRAASHLGRMRQYAGTIGDCVVTDR